MIKGVRLDVGFVNYIETIAITKVKPIGILRIVRGPYRIDVKLLHELNIFFHQFAADGASGNRIMIMMIHAFDHHRFPVDKQLTFTYLNLTKADCTAYAFTAICRFESDYKRI